MADHVSALLLGTVDVAVIRPLDDSSSVVVDHLITEPVAIALTLDDPLADRAHVDIADLADRPWVIMAAQTSRRIYEVFLRKCAEGGFVPLIRYTSNSLSANLATAAAGGGVFPCPLSTPVPPGSGLTLVPISGWTTGIDVATRADEDNADTSDLVAAIRAVATGIAHPVGV